ncbi:hypothetical protein UlMin_003564 [Ulmus minor]
MNTFFTIFLFFIPIFILLIKRTRSSKRLPPGSLGIPIMGQSLSLFRAMRATTADKWLENRIRKYGPILKLSLFGKPAVFLHGQAANKFIFNSDDSTIASEQTKSIQMILGDRNLLELNGEDHKRVRGAIMLFLKPESLKQYVGKMEQEIKQHLEMHWQGKQLVTMIGGMWSVPVNLPFTRYNRSLKASRMVQNLVKQHIQEKRVEIEQKGASPYQDPISCLLSTRKEDNTEIMTEKEIIHNVMLVMIAGHDNSSVLITFIMQFLANKPDIYAEVLQEEIAKSKAFGEFLTWEDLAKMKFTWRVAMETLRVVPPVFGGFKKAETPMTHMDNNIYPKPSKFDTNKFKNQVAAPPFSFFAWIETLITMHYFVTQFKWKLLAGNSFRRNPTPIPNQGLPVYITQKKPL